MKKKVTAFRRTSTFTSSEEEDKPEEDNQRNPESEAEAQETTWKCDVRVERLHKNIVDHKLGQYRRWQERQEELKSKPAGNTKPAVASKTKTVKSKAVVESSGSDGDSESEELLSKFQNRLKKIKEGREKAQPVAAKTDVKSPKAKQGGENSKVPDPQPPVRTESAKSPNTPVVSKPMFESNSSSDDEDQTQLVDMLFNMISQEDEGTNDKSTKLDPPVEAQVEPAGESVSVSPVNEGTEEEENIKENEDFQSEATKETENNETAGIILSEFSNLKSFAMVLKLVLGFERINEHELLSLETLEKLTQESLTNLHQAPADFEAEDRKYLREHGLKSLQVNISNIKKDPLWNCNEDEYVEEVKSSLGDKDQWAEILSVGLKEIKDSLTPKVDPIVSPPPPENCSDENQEVPQTQTRSEDKELNEISEDCLPVPAIEENPSPPPPVKENIMEVDSSLESSVPTEVMRDLSPPVVDRSREKRSLSVSSEESVKTSKTTKKVSRRRSISTDSESEQMKTKTPTPKPKRNLSDSSDDSLPSRERERPKKSSRDQKHKKHKKHKHSRHGDLADNKAYHSPGRERTFSEVAEPEVSEPGRVEAEGGGRGAGEAPGPGEEAGEGGRGGDCQSNTGQEGVGELLDSGHRAAAPVQRSQISLCLCLYWNFYSDHGLECGHLFPCFYFFSVLCCEILIFSSAPVILISTWSGSSCTCLCSSQSFYLDIYHCRMGRPSLCQCRTTSVSSVETSRYSGNTISLDTTSYTLHVSIILPNIKRTDKQLT